MGTRYFTSDLFRFLEDLAANNNRTWFQTNKDVYERHVRDPALRFIDDFAGPLAKFAPSFEADTRTVGGSLFRIHRDTRFSKDKIPYKTNTGMHFRHEAATDVHAPGFYLHIDPTGTFMGAGLWRPDSKSASAIRARIDEEQAAWKKATRSKRLTDVFELTGDTLIRPPKGFDPDHPLITDLKRKDFIASSKLSRRDVTSADFLETFTDRCKRATPFMRFLCDAMGLDF